MDGWSHQTTGLRTALTYTARPLKGFLLYRQYTREILADYFRNINIPRICTHNTHQPTSLAHRWFYLVVYQNLCGKAVWPTGQHGEDAFHFSVVQTSTDLKCKYATVITFTLDNMLSSMLDGDTYTHTLPLWLYCSRCYIRVLIPI